MGVELAQYGLVMTGWVVAFMLGRELHFGFAQWQETRRGR
jgi:hypothetical protein